MLGRIIGVIPARQGSKRIPRKNVVSLAGVPLIVHTIRAALGSGRLDEVVVSTDGEEIAQVSREGGAQVIYPRPSELCTDSAGTLEVLRHTVQVLDSDDSPVDVVVLLQPSSPFRSAAFIDAAIERMEATAADTVTAVRPVVEHPYYLWRPEGDRLEPLHTRDHHRVSRRDLPPYYVETGAIVAVRRSVLMSVGLYGEKIVPIEAEGFVSVDIDEPVDLEWAEFLIQRGLAVLPPDPKTRRATSPEKR